MDINKDTFDGQLEAIIEDINNSDFIAIDGEFTGLDKTATGHAMPFETPEKRYDHMRQHCSDFMLIQFGLCAFKADEEKMSYKAKPYNFDVFPTPFSQHAEDRTFLCQSSSIKFLRSHGFDFNKLFSEGIPYLTPKQEKTLRDELNHKYEKASKGKTKKRPTAVPEEQQPFLDKICAQILRYLEGEQKEPLIIPGCESSKRNLIYKMVQEQFPDVHIKTETGKKKIKSIEVTSLTSAEKQQQQELLKEKQKLEMMELDKDVGFTKVISALRSSQKLIVGHNMLLDVFHTLNTFLGILPADLGDFKTETKSVFPSLLDTKLMATTQPLNELISSSVLEKLFQKLQKAPFLPVHIDVADGFERYQNESGALHEAGYDAFITGCCFTTMINYLGTIQSPPIEFTLPSSPVVEQYINKLYLMKSKDIPYINLDSPDSVNEEPPESINTAPDLVNNQHVFHVTMREGCKSEDLEALFHPYGQIQIEWLTETSAYVELCEKEHATIALTELSKQVGIFNVVSYADHQLIKPSSFSPASSSTALSAPRVASKHKLEATENTASCKEIRLSVSPEKDEALSNIIREDENSDSSNSDHTFDKF